MARADAARPDRSATAAQSRRASCAQASDWQRGDRRACWTTLAVGLGGAPRHPVPAARTARPGLCPVDRRLLGRRYASAASRRRRPSSCSRSSIPIRCWSGWPTEVRQGKIFAGLTRDIEGFLRHDFEKQKIKSFLSVSVFAHGHLWGTLAVNDCVDERAWTRRREGRARDRRAGHRRGHRTRRCPKPMSARSSAAR